MVDGLSIFPSRSIENFTSNLICDLTNSKFGVYPPTHAKGLVCHCICVADLLITRVRDRDNYSDYLYYRNLLSIVSKQLAMNSKSLLIGDLDLFTNPNWIGCGLLCDREPFPKIYRQSYIIENIYIYN